MNEPEQPGGPPAERLREQLERELGEVPADSPTEPDEQSGRDEESDESDEAEAGDQDESESGEPDEAERA